MNKTTTHKLRILGLMSGTSLDGLDIAYCEFSYKNKWEYKVLAAESFEYDDQLKTQLSEIEEKSALSYVQLDHELGAYFSELILAFISKHQLSIHEIDAIASHGQTIFHQPNAGYTSQIGNGAIIAAKTGIQTVCDFRTLDVGLGGQGAPLVPIGDELLYGAYDNCLNLGGIANFSFNEGGTRQSYDICFANMVGNYLCEEIGMSYDAGGNIAKTGVLQSDLLAALNEFPYFDQPHPKSLGKEEFLSFFKPTLDRFQYDTADKLHTFGVHLGEQIGKLLKPGNCLITGGGAFNAFWVAQIGANTQTSLVVPDQQTIAFKEAILFGFLGALRLSNQMNTLAAVTGAQKNSIGGAIYAAN